MGKLGNSVSKKRVPMSVLRVVEGIVELEVNYGRG